MIFTPTYNQCDSDGDRFVKEIGYAAICMMGSRRYQAYRFASMAAWTRQPIEQRQIRFFADQYNEVAGYVTWAHLTAEVARKFLSEKNYILHPSEWNEGDLVWIMDICANQLDFRAMAADILEMFEGKTDYLHWESRKRTGTRIARYAFESNTITYLERIAEDR